MTRPPDPPGGSIERATMRRVVVVGCSNSGKSTLARSLADAMDAPFIELDALFWMPEWQGRDLESFRTIADGATQGDTWVVAGNYRRVADVVWPRADTMVWLDLPLPLLLRRCLVRSWRRWRDRELLWGTNRESFWRHLGSRDSLLWYLARTYRRNRREFAAIPRDPCYAGLRFIRLASPREVDRWLDAVVAPR